VLLSIWFVFAARRLLRRIIEPNAPRTG
jgi:hypothetical protein